MTRFELQHLDINGDDIAFRSAGTGPVLLLVHGMAGRSSTWRSVMPALAQHFTVIAPDLLGHGASAKPRTDYSLGAFATGLRDLLDALGHRHATLVGQSLGGGIAMQFAYQYAERCDALVLVSSGGLGSEVSPLLRALTIPGAEYALPLLCARPLSDAGRAAASWFSRLGLRPAPNVEEMWGSYASLADAETRTAFLHTLRAVVDLSGQRVSAKNRLHLAAQKPTLIVWGDRDGIIPVQHAYASHDAMPGSQLEIFEGAGHFPHCEQPERFVSVLADFLAAAAPEMSSAS